MSNNDISRFLFQPAKHYTGMRMQQGRVLLDSDYNEGASHSEEDQRKTLLDLIGPQGTPDTGFAIGRLGLNRPGATVFFPLKVGDKILPRSVRFNGVDDQYKVNIPEYFVGPGSMYVAGKRVEIEEPEFIAFQTDYLQVTPANLPTMFPDDASSPSSGTFKHVFFLHVWEQWVSAVEDDEFLEHALGGPDTSLRVRRMRRVEFANGEETDDCALGLFRILSDRFGQLAEFNTATGEVRSFALLKIGFTTGTSQDTCAPCEPGTTGRYLGAENQAIRIMLTSPSTYVWAIDDAAPLYRARLTDIGSQNGTVTVKLDTLPKDEEHWPTKGRVIEILPWSAVLSNGEKVGDEAGVADGIGVFCQASGSYQPADQTFSIDTSGNDSSNQPIAAKLDALIHAWDENHPDVQAGHLPSDGADPRLFYVRFWHQTTAANPTEISTTSGAQLGATGLVPDFLDTIGMPGDYWIAAVRPETDTVIIPLDLQSPSGTPPHGPKHFYAPLSIVTGTTENPASEIVVTSYNDCRRTIFPLTEGGCCTVTVGDGEQSSGQFMSIQDAINALPPSGGHVCVRPGTYFGEITLMGHDNITITGCGDLTVIQSSQQPNPQAPLIQLTGGFNQTVHSLTVRATGQVGIGVGGGRSPRVFDIRVEAVPFDDPTLFDDAPLVDIEGASDTWVHDLDIFALRRTGIHVSGGGGLTFVDNLFTGSPLPVKVSNIKVRGTPALSADALPPTEPLARVHGNRALLEGWVLMAFGQFGLQCESTAIEMRNMTIQSFPFSPDHPAKSALFMASCECVVKDSILQISSQLTDLIESGISNVPSEHATVFLTQAKGVFERNEVTATSNFSIDRTCWGGVQLGPGDYQIRGNRIIGGAGHGITLGAAIWYVQGSTPNFFDPNDPNIRFEGAGKTQMNADGTVTGNLRGGFDDPENPTVHFLPHCEGIGKVDIVDNVIEQMGTNGISVLTLFGFLTGDSLVTMNGPCRIQGNRIRFNLANPSADVVLAEHLMPIGGSQFGPSDTYPLQLPFIPFGGIVLGGAGGTGNSPEDETGPLDLEICGNIVEDNGTNPLLPFNGIFVLAGPSIAITDNHVRRNGVVPKETDVDSTHTLKTGHRSGISVAFAGAAVGTRQDVADYVGGTLRNVPSSSSLRISGNVVQQPEGRALFAVGFGPMSIENNFLSSQGFNGSLDSPYALAEISAIGDVVYVHNLGRPWEGFPSFESPNAVPPPNNSIPDEDIAFMADTLSEDDTPEDILFVGHFGGQTIFNNNQVVYDYAPQPAIAFKATSDKLSYAVVALVSLDHLSVNSNNFAFRLDLSNLTLSSKLPSPPFSVSDTSFDYGNRPVMTHVLALGHTVDVGHNRVAEGLQVSEASIFSIGFAMNSTVFNVTTHCSSVHGRPDAIIQDVGNVTLLQPANGCIQQAGVTNLWTVLEAMTDQFISWLFFT